MKHTHSAVQEEYEEQLQELERLRWVHETSQMQHITTLAWQAKQEAMLHVLKAADSRATAIEVALHDQCIAGPFSNIMASACQSYK